MIMWLAYWIGLLAGFACGISFRDWQIRREEDRKIFRQMGREMARNHIMILEKIGKP